MWVAVALVPAVSLALHIDNFRIVDDVAEVRWQAQSNVVYGLISTNDVTRSPTTWPLDAFIFVPSNGDWVASMPVDGMAAHRVLSLLELVDTDLDGLPDSLELLLGLNPNHHDSDDNGTPDGQEDADRDTLGNLEELMLGTDLESVDSDGDGWDDATEIAEGLDPLDPLSGPLVEISALPAGYLNGVIEVPTGNVSIATLPASFLNGIIGSITGTAFTASAPISFENQ